VRKPSGGRAHRGREQVAAFAPSGAVCDKETAHGRATRNLVDAISRIEAWTLTSICGLRLPPQHAQDILTLLQYSLADLRSRARPRMRSASSPPTATDPGLRWSTVGHLRRYFP